MNEIDRIIKLVLEKNAAYGDAWQDLGTITPAVRIIDKVRRLDNLYGTDKDIGGECIIDTLSDIVGYVLLAIAYRKQCFESTEIGPMRLPKATITEGVLEEAKWEILKYGVKPEVTIKNAIANLLTLAHSTLSISMGHNFEISVCEQRNYLFTMQNIGALALRILELYYLELES